MKRTTSLIGAVLVLGALLLGACGPAVFPPSSATPPGPTPAGESAGSAQLANPAALFCRERDYRSEIRTAADGGQHGVCIFPDGSECGDWAFFRGECGQAWRTPVAGQSR